MVGQFDVARMPPEKGLRVNDPPAALRIVHEQMIFQAPGENMRLVDLEVVIDVGGSGEVLVIQDKQGRFCNRLNLLGHALCVDRYSLTVGLIISVAVLRVGPQPTSANKQSVVAHGHDGYSLGVVPKHANPARPFSVISPSWIERK